MRGFPMFSSFENFTYFLYSCPLDDIFILEYGYNNFEKCNADYSKRYQHNYSIHLVLDGEGTLNYNGKQYHLKKNDIFYLPPCENFSYYPNTQLPWKYVWFLYNGKKAKELSNLTGLSDTSPVLHLENNLSESCKKLFYKLFICSKKQNDDVGLEALSSFLFFIKKLEALKQQNEVFDTIEQEKKYNAILKLLRLNYSNHNISIHDLLSSVYISHSYACKLFKKFSTKTIQEHLIQIRMDAAIALLETTEITIKHVAQRVGYSDQLVFSRQFKKYAGLSPLAYREKNKVNSDNTPPTQLK